MSTITNAAGNLFAGLFALGFFMLIATAFIVHVVYCISINWAAMLIGGIVFPPLGIGHGLYVMANWAFG